MTRLNLAVSLVSAVFASSAFAQAPKCPVGECWHKAGNHCMSGEADKAGYCPIPDEEKFPKLNLHTHADVTVTGVSTSGKQGREALSAQGFLMVEAKVDLNDRNRVTGTLHLTPDLYTMDADGYPLIGQYGELKRSGSIHKNSQHNHPFIMGTEVRYEFKINECESVAANHAIIGEAPGPHAFMHRESAAGNPNAPLTHHNTDLTHITFNVNGITYKNCKVKLYAAAHSGQEPNPVKPGIAYYKPDSFSMSAEYCEGCRVSLGASFGKILSTHQEVTNIGEHHHDPHSGPEREVHLKGWVSTKNDIKGGKLATSTIYGQVRNLDEDFTSRGILHEGNFTRNLNKYFYRMEGQDRRPEVEFGVHGAGHDPQMFKAFTGGYERDIARKGGATFSVGGSVTKTFVPSSMKNYYGGNPWAGEGHFRLLFMNNKSF